ncbi:phytanoyl-CoA dioxygenase family protein [Pluralibacter gergoviae]|uniref:Phytanoyl-CoA dioxygenase family protein n=1 Tax=Pluralibacter gergoviae TaxID=61647 RepID=A0AAW8HWR5_PLUGE|nr:phytanoyl-CoA dioxygenase family protein [Pluralibacter gergoviae]AVR05640.1 phytanoyl-CoA dioxygenase [Pluralibacter gergoviae]KMK04855.1 phytanoyl-CoA dioxygenase [Pluralibacter gergoviae]KMK25846.1 phytanoyl-CoA dioxygenase [Pluralibacter gergoviae]MDQ2311591.1 phytanoyl-CoA dioxygenase family protein [Pluralibacter gergoviae]SUB69833.1 Phytanoyl-CoA dioxygenase (PhyH) [Pluralibacter gergoviae]
MEKQAEVWLEALGAGAELTAKMRDELDTLGYTVVEGVADAAWLAAMRERLDALVVEEGDNLAIEHHQEATATRIANLVNKGVVWEKVWCHPLILSACRYVFNGEFKLSSLNAREALRDGGHQPLHADWKRPRADFPKVHLVNTIWAIDDLSAANGAPRIVPATHLRRELPEEALADVDAPHPDEVIFEAPAGSVMIYNAHAWHGGTRNAEGSRRRVLHGLYIDRNDVAQQDQRRWLRPETAGRLTPAQKWLLDVE